MLLIESVEGLSGFLSIVAGSYYCAAAAPSGMLASLNGILASAVFGAGSVTSFFNLFALNSYFY